MKVQHVMKIGDRIGWQLYEQVAQASFAEGTGRVMVLCNNSSHYLVAEIASEHETEANLVKSYPYYDQPENTRYVYGQALTAMAARALER